MTTRAIYIAGQAYSGSTVLCALLGVHPEMEPVSELAMWTLKAERTQRICSCGRTRLECPFWSIVNGRWLEAIAPLSLDFYAALQRRIETLRYTWPRMLSARAWSEAGEMAAYSRATVKMYESVVAASGRPIVIDSSKKPGRALALIDMDGLDVSILHLVRDGLSFVDSNLRRSKLSTTDPNFLYRVFRLGTKWSAANFAAERALKMNGGRGVQLRYEDLLRDPEAALKKVEAGIGVDLSIVREHVRAGRPISWRHMESGSRHREAGPTTLQPAFAQRVDLPLRVRLAFHLGSWPTSRRYGYL